MAHRANHRQARLLCAAAAVLAVCIVVAAPASSAAGEFISQPNKVPNMDNFQTPNVKPGTKGALAFTLTNRYSAPITDFELELETYQMSTLKEDFSVSKMDHPPRFTKITLEEGAGLGVIETPTKVLIRMDRLEEYYVQPVDIVLNSPQAAATGGKASVDVDFTGKSPLDSAWYQVGSQGNWTPIFSNWGTNTYRDNFTVQGLAPGINQVYFAVRDKMNNTFAPKTHEYILTVQSDAVSAPASGAAKMGIYSYFRNFAPWTNYTVSIQITTHDDTPQGTYLVRSRLSFTHSGQRYLMMSRGHFTLAAWKSATDGAVLDPRTNATGNIDLAKLSTTASGENVNISGIVVDTAFSVMDPFPSWGRWALYGAAGFFAVLALAFFMMDEYGKFPRAKARFDDLAYRWRTIKRRRLRKVAERDRRRLDAKRRKEKD